MGIFTSFGGIFNFFVCIQNTAAPSLPWYIVCFLCMMKLLNRAGPVDILAKTSTIKCSNSGFENCNFFLFFSHLKHKQMRRLF